VGEAEPGAAATWPRLPGVQGAGRCGIGAVTTKVPAYETFTLMATGATVSPGSWTVYTFSGTYVVSLSCPGGAPSRGQFKVTRDRHVVT
jgi:hypothetical protein